MKYLLVGLILLVGAVGRPATLPAPAHDLHATAVFSAGNPQGTTTEADINLDDSATPAQVRLSVYRDRHTCDGGVCREVRLIAAYTAQTMPSGDGEIDRQFRGGFVHGVLRLHDDVSNTDLAVRVDITWSASGPPACNPLPFGAVCVRNATVLGNVASGADRFIADQTVPDGQLVQRYPAS